MRGDHLEVEAGLLDPGGHRVGGGLEQTGEIDRSAEAGSVRRLEPRKLQEPASQSFQALLLRERAIEPAPVALIAGGVLEHLEVGAQRRERRPQLVRRVAHEAPQRRDCRFDLGRHVVEGACQATDLVAAGDLRARAEVAGCHAIAGRS